MVRNVSTLPIPHGAPLLLCVDDDPLILGLIQKLLEKRGYRVLGAPGGDEALKIFRGNRIDLVVVDYDMPGMKGHELAAELKSLNPQIPVIMQSGSPNLPQTVTSAADAFLPKGHSFDPLFAAISTLIKGHGKSAVANAMSA